MLDNRRAYVTILLLGVVNLIGDVVYEVQEGLYLAIYIFLELQHLLLDLLVI